MSTSTLVPGACIGENDKYRVLRLLGEGGMGMVFEAEHTLTHKRVALKWMRPELARTPDVGARFLREAQAAARVRHPNVVDIYDYGRHGDAAYLVMEYLEGETLTRALQRADLPWSTLLGLLLPAMHAVAAAHKQGVIHRDVKPDNIFLSRHGDLVAAKVLDFGISKLEPRGDEALSLTRTGTTMGTPHYMSYEQLVGEKQIDGRTDVYAFGVILYELLTGRRPFEAETFSALVVKVATTEPPPPAELRPDLPPALQNVVQWALAKNRDQRCPNMEALIGALEPFANASGAAGPSSASGLRGRAIPPAKSDSQRAPAPAAPTLGSTPRSRAPVIGSVLVVLVLALSATAWFAWNRGAPRAAGLPPPPPAAPASAPAAPDPAHVAAPKPRSVEEAPPAHEDDTAAQEPSAPKHGEVTAHHHHHAAHAHDDVPAAAVEPSASLDKSGTPPAAAPGVDAHGAAREQSKSAGQEESRWYVTPEGRRIMRAPQPGASAPGEAAHAPYTTPSGRVVIPAP